MTLLERLLRRRLLLVTGKGGVGKSAVAAALARLLERSGRDVFLLEADPRESLFGVTGPWAGGVPATAFFASHPHPLHYLPFPRPSFLAVIEECPRSHLPRVTIRPIFRKEDPCVRLAGSS